MTCKLAVALCVMALSPLSSYSQTENDVSQRSNFERLTFSANTGYVFGFTHESGRPWNLGSFVESQSISPETYYQLAEAKSSWALTPALYFGGSIGFMIYENTQINSKVDISLGYEQVDREFRSVQKLREGANDYSLYFTQLETRRNFRLGIDAKVERFGWSLGLWVNDVSNISQTAEVVIHENDEVLNREALDHTELETIGDGYNRVGWYFQFRYQVVPGLSLESGYDLNFVKMDKYSGDTLSRFFANTGIWSNNFYLGMKFRIDGKGL